MFPPLTLTSLLLAATIVQAQTTTECDPLEKSEFLPQLSEGILIANIYQHVRTIKPSLPNSPRHFPAVCRKVGDRCHVKDLYRLVPKEFLLDTKKQKTVHR